MIDQELQLSWHVVCSSVSRWIVLGLSVCLGHVLTFSNATLHSTIASCHCQCDVLLHHVTCCNTSRSCAHAVCFAFILLLCGLDPHYGLYPSICTTISVHVSYSGTKVIWTYMGGRWLMSPFTDVVDFRSEDRGKIMIIRSSHMVVPHTENLHTLKCHKVQHCMIHCKTCRVVHVCFHCVT